MSSFQQFVDLCKECGTSIGYPILEPVANFGGDIYASGIANQYWSNFCYIEDLDKIYVPVVQYDSYNGAYNINNIRRVRVLKFDLNSFYVNYSDIIIFVGAGDNNQNPYCFTYCVYLSNSDSSYDGLYLVSWMPYTYGNEHNTVTILSLHTQQVVDNAYSSLPNSGALVKYHSINKKLYFADDYGNYKTFDNGQVVDATQADFDAADMTYNFISTYNTTTKTQTFISIPNIYGYLGSDNKYIINIENQGTYKVDFTIGSLLPDSTTLYRNSNYQYETNNSGFRVAGWVPNTNKFLLNKSWYKICNSCNDYYYSEARGEYFFIDLDWVF